MYNAGYMEYILDLFARSIIDIIWIIVLFYFGKMVLRR